MHRVSSYEGKKVPQCAWSNGLLVGQSICMYEIFPCSCYHIILASEQVLQSAGACMPIDLFHWRLARRELIANICQGLLDKCVKYFKRLYFCQIALFKMFFIVIRSRNIWPMIYWLGAFQRYLSQLWSSVAGGGRICSSDILLASIISVSGSTAYI